MIERVEPGLLAPVMRQASFSGRAESTRIFARHVLTLLPSGEGRRVLDLGSGTGDVAVLVHDARPAARVTGIDFAPANVAAAQARAAAIGIAFVCADYLEWQGGPFDLIAADSVLHLIEAPVTNLAAKLVTDLIPSGVVVATVPDLVLLNRIHLLLRRLWRWTPPVADRLAMALAAWLYRGLSRQALADRLPYLRLLPRLFGPEEQRIFAAAGLTLERNDPWPSPSLAKPRHRLMVWRRSA
jgi:trans-aconitate methyltransferase